MHQFRYRRCRLGKDVYLPNLHLLDLSYNSLTTLHMHQFRYMPYLTTVDVSFNLLQRIFEYDTSHGMSIRRRSGQGRFGLRKLVHLIVAGLPLYHLDSKTMPHLPALRILNLSDSVIYQISGRMDQVRYDIFSCLFLLYNVTQV